MRNKIRNALDYLREPEKEAIRKLHEHGVNYIIVGGVAVRLHGHECDYDRSAEDLDIVVEQSGENSDSIIKAIIDLGGDPSKMDEVRRRLALPSQKITIVDLEIFTSFNNLEFSELRASQVLFPSPHFGIPVISKEHLIQSKKVAAVASDRTFEKRRIDEEDLKALLSCA